MNDSVTLKKNKGARPTEKPEEYYTGKCAMRHKSDASESPFEKHYFLLLPKRNFFAFYKTEGKTVIRKMIILVKDIRRFGWEQRTLCYTIVAQNNEVFQVSFPDEKLDQNFDRILTSKFKNSQAMGGHYELDYCKQLFMFMADRVNPKKKDAIIIPEFTQTTTNLKPLLEIQSLKSFKFMAKDPNDTPFERRLWMGVVRLAERQATDNLPNDWPDEIPDMRDVGVVMCSGRQLVNFDLVQFPHVYNLYQNDLSSVVLPDWMDFDMTYLFPVNGSNAHHQNGSGSTQFPYKRILPLQFFNKGYFRY